MNTDNSNKIESEISTRLYNLSVWILILRDTNNRKLEMKDEGKDLKSINKYISGRLEHDKKYFLDTCKKIKSQIIAEDLRDNNDK